MAIDLARAHALRNRIAAASKAAVAAVTGHVESEIFEKALAAGEASVVEADEAVKVIAGVATPPPAPKPATAASAPATPPKATDEPKKS